MRRDALLAAALSPVAFTSYLLSLGVDVGAATGDGFAAPALYATVLSAVGVLVTATHDRGLLTPLPVATALLLVVPWFAFGTGRPGVVGPESLTVLDVLPSVVVAVALVFGLSALEHAATEHPRIRARLDGRTGVGSIAVGVVYAAVALGASGLRLGVATPLEAAFALWVVAGLVALGAVPVYVGVRLNRLSPPAVAAAGLLLVLVAPAADPFSFGALYAAGWVVPLCVSLVAAAAEGRVRHYGTGEPSPRF